MKYYLVFLLTIFYYNISNSQNMLSFINFQEDEIKTEIDESPKIKLFKSEIISIESDIKRTKEEINVIKNILSDMSQRKEALKSQNIKVPSSLIDSISFLEVRKSEQESIISNLSVALIDKINNLSKEYILDINTNKFVLAGNLSLNPLGNGDGTKILPELAANYHNNYDFGKSFFGRYEVNLNMKSPVQNKDSSKVLTNIVNAGADGSLDFGLKLGWGKNNKKFAILAGIDGKLNWLYSRDYEVNSVSSIGYGIFSTLVAFKVYPIVVAVQGDYSFSSNSQNNFISNELNKKWSTNLLIGLNLDNYQMQIKYLLNSNVAKITDERLELKFGVAYDPF